MRGELSFSGECKGKPVSELQMIIESGLDQLPDTIDSYMNPGLLSGGEKELLNLTTAIQSSPDILICLLYTSPSPRDGLLSRMPSSA